eukprot:gnl/MRDRNA2_/MRDRNA2_133590_c0_seq1.p1 gnl/MRDRNA2_/MRDRNA2_133590_c0~~gnl/MRDRNA2_/MRDRNA2_133590_c0_seq1.p1  ORF type:complete len:847 (-),score=190.24 gnl/MRDRNA2_/MRDRNA2_133590_c0_seq1:114-2330(-)
MAHQNSLKAGDRVSFTLYNAQQDSAQAKEVDYVPLHRNGPARAVPASVSDPWALVPPSQAGFAGSGLGLSMVSRCEESSVQMDGGFDGLENDIVRDVLDDLQDACGDEVNLLGTDLEKDLDLDLKGWGDALDAPLEELTKSSSCREKSHHTAPAVPAPKEPPAPPNDVISKAFPSSMPPAFPPTLKPPISGSRSGTPLASAHVEASVAPTLVPNSAPKAKPLMPPPQGAPKPLEEFSCSGMTKSISSRSEVLVAKPESEPRRSRPPPPMVPPPPPSHRPPPAPQSDPARSSSQQSTTASTVSDVVQTEPQASPRWLHSEKPSDGLVAGTVMMGLVKSFCANNGFGFIDSPEAGDLWFSKADVCKEKQNTLLPGDRISFTLYRGPQRGNLQARKVEFLEAGSRMGNGMVNGKGGTAASYGTTETRPKGFAAEGWVRSYSADNGYGFISCDDKSLLKDAKAERAGDVFFPRDELCAEDQKGFPVGTMVSFELYRSPYDDKPRARMVRQKKETCKEQSTVSQPVSRKEGKVKKYNMDKGFGFIGVQGLGDVFFPREEVLPEDQNSLLVGDIVTFELYCNPHEPNKPRARVVRLRDCDDPLPAAANCSSLPDPVMHTSLNSTLVAAASKTGNPGKGAHVPAKAKTEILTPKSASSIVKSVKEPVKKDMNGREVTEGRVKSYNSTKGFGFITARSQSTSGEFWFPKAEVSFEQQEALRMGTLVAFEPHRTPDGRLQARRVRPL